MTGAMTRDDLKAQVCALRDGRMRERLNTIIAERGITTIVETGLDMGGSTTWFAEMALNVIGIDNVAERVNRLYGLLNVCGITNVRLICRNSPDALRQLVVEGIDAAHTLFLLDAHWQAYWPLRDEVKVIPRGQGVLVMHDARVPGCPDLGVDEYDGVELSYEYVKDVLTEWSPTHRVEYNDSSAEWPHRGVMYVFPE